MAEFLLELYSEEIPPQLQINARKELKQILEKSIHTTIWIVLKCWYTKKLPNDLLLVRLYILN